LLSSAELRAILRGLRANAPEWFQGGTTWPPLVAGGEEQQADCVCALGMAAWEGRRLRAVGAIARFVEQLCRHADERLGEPGAINAFLNWHDEAPRAEVRRVLLRELRRELTRRARALAA
jgi:hypothetical protein